VFRVKFEKHFAVGVSLMTKLDQQRREQSTEVLLLILPEITVKKSQRREPSFPHGIDVLDDCGADKYDKFLRLEYQILDVPKNALSCTGYERKNYQIPQKGQESGFNRRFP
jgi:hypothetical protein